MAARSLFDILSLLTGYIALSYTVLYIKELYVVCDVIVRNSYA